MMSVMNPGVIRNAPPKITSTPSITSRCGILPSASAVLKRRHTDRPCERSSSAPSSGIGRQEQDRRHATPMASPTFRITYSSASGSTMKSAIRASRGTA